MEQPNDYFSKCPICSCPQLQLVYDFGSFCVMKCKDCANAWRTNMYDRDKIEDIYCSEEYENHPFFSYYVEDDIKNLTNNRFKSQYRALDRIESMIGVGKLLDVGCGSGVFLSIAKGRGWDVQGIELSPGLSKVCEHNAGAPVINAAFEDVDLSEGAYDVITFWDIIEHVMDPGAVIAKARRLLRPGGLVLFCTPNEDSLLARAGWALYKFTGSTYSYPALALHPDYHTYFFSKTGFVRMLEERDLTVIDCLSQEAHIEHSPLASAAQKAAISMIEKVGTVFDSCYEMVVLARA